MCLEAAADLNPIHARHGQIEPQEGWLQHPYPDENIIAIRAALYVLSDICGLSFALSNCSTSTVFVPKFSMFFNEIGNKLAHPSVVLRSCFASTHEHDRGHDV